MLPKSVTPSRIESNFKGRLPTLANMRSRADHRYEQDIELSDEELDQLEKAASAHPPKRTVNPNWGLDVFEDAQQKKLHARL